MDIKSMKEAVQVEDEKIILGEPLIMKKYGKKFEIKQIRYLDWDKFTSYLLVFLNHYYVVCGFSKLPDNLNELKEFRNNIRTTMSKKNAFKSLIKMLKISRLNTSFIRKKFSPDDIAELFVYVYLYNVLGVKKNFRDGLKQLGIAA